MLEMQHSMGFHSTEEHFEEHHSGWEKIQIASELYIQSVKNQLCDSSMIMILLAFGLIRTSSYVFMILMAATIRKTLPESVSAFAWILV